MRERERDVNGVMLYFSHWKETKEDKLLMPAATNGDILLKLDLDVFRSNIYMIDWFTSLITSPQNNYLIIVDGASFC